MLFLWRLNCNLEISNFFCHETVEYFWKIICVYFITILRKYSYVGSINPNILALYCKHDTQQWKTSSFQLLAEWQSQCSAGSWPERCIGIIPSFDQRNRPWGRHRDKIPQKKSEIFSTSSPYNKSKSKSYCNCNSNSNRDILILTLTLICTHTDTDKLILGGRISIRFDIAVRK